MNSRAFAVLLLLASTALSGCSYELQHALNEDDANDIYTLLSENGIAAKKSKEEGGNEATYLIVVNKTDAAQATKLLREHSLPRPQHSGWEGIMKNKGMIPTEMEQRAMALQAQQGEIERGLNKIDGVLEVHAIPMQPENNDLTQPEKKPLNSAAILLKYRPTAEGKSPLSEQKIREYVAAALPDTRPENVNVILTEARPPGTEINEQSRMVTVLGMQMTAASASSFRLLIGVVGFAMFVMVGLTLFAFMREAGGAHPKPRRG